MVWRAMRLDAVYEGSVVEGLTSEILRFAQDDRCAR
jgi:hypothetical protein